MKKHLRYLLFSLALMLSLNCAPMNVHAATIYDDADELDMSNHYNTLMNTSFANCYIIAQPSSALVLNTNLSITSTNLSPNYTSGVIDLPRLNAQYYYKLRVYDSDAQAGATLPSNLSVSRTLYPSLTWVEQLPQGTTFIIDIVNHDTNATVKSAVVSVMEDLPGIDTAAFQDVSKSMISELLNNNATKYDAMTTYYPAELHQDSIITSNYSVGYSENYQGYLNSLIQSTLGVGEVVDLNNAETFQFTTGSADTQSVRDLVWPYIQATDNSRPEYFAVFDPTGYGVDYDSNEGIVTTVASINTTYDSEYIGVYAICTGTEFELFKIKKDVLSDSLTGISTNAEIVEIEYDKEFNIEELLGDPYAYKNWSTLNSNNFNTTNYPNVKYTKDSTQKCNVFSSAMAYGGVNPHRATFLCNESVPMFNLKTWYFRPDSSTQYLCDNLSLQVGSKAPTLRNPSDSISMYTFDTWYTDINCTNKANLATIMKDATEGETVNLYGKYNYTGGEYTVQFYNDYTQESVTETYECRYQPTLPENPTRPGYLFNNWKIVSNTSSTSGTDYNSDSFYPQKNKSYLFKTFWDVSGTIVDVVANKKEYYVNDIIDKSTIVVTVQTDNTGATRTLNTEEFTLSPSKVTTAGNNQILVTYDATGATDTVDLTGRAVKAVSLTARYSGTNLYVGDTVSNADVMVTVNYNNNTSENVTDFTLSPTTISNAGSNTIRVIYGNLSTTINVTGKKASTGSSGGSNSGGGSSTSGSTHSGGSSSIGGTSGTGTTTGTGTNIGASTIKKLSGLSATYNGPELYVGDVIKPNYFNVKASYSDGTNSTLSATSFSFSPSYIRQAGTNTIVVSYGGLSSNVTISATEKSSMTSDVSDMTNATTTVQGVDENGNPILSGMQNTGTTNAITNEAAPVPLGNPLTGAGMSSGDKGTSKGYMNGANILTGHLYGDATSVENDTDILKQIQNAGATASSITVDLYNGAVGNDITQEMLEALQEKQLTMYINILNPSEPHNKLGEWTVLGEMLTNTACAFNPNITFEVTEKGAETLTLMAIQDGDYPDNIMLTVYPAVSTYASGELIRMYSCGFDKTNAHLEKSFAWADDVVAISFDLNTSKRYCLSNALNAYEEGASLTTDISLPSESELVETSTEETSTEEEFDWGETEEEFDWGDTDTDTTVQPQKKSVPVLPIVAGGVLLLCLGGGGFLLFKLRSGKSKPNPRRLNDITDDEDEDVMYDEDDYIEEDDIDSPDTEEDDELPDSEEDDIVL